MTQEKRLKLYKKYKELEEIADILLIRQKEILCELIDLCNDNTIYVWWYGKEVPKEKAKHYVWNSGY